MGRRERLRQVAYLVFLVERGLIDVMKSYKRYVCMIMMCFASRLIEPGPSLVSLSAACGLVFRLGLRNAAGDLGVVFRSG